MEQPSRRECTVDRILSSVCGICHTAFSDQSTQGYRLLYSVEWGNTHYFGISEPGRVRYIKRYIGPTEIVFDVPIDREQHFPGVIRGFGIHSKCFDLLQPRITGEDLNFDEHVPTLWQAMWSSCLQRGVLRTKTAATNDSIQPVKPESKADELAHMVNILSTYKLFGVRYYHPVISEQEEACVISLRQSNQREAFGSMLQSALEHRCVALPDRNVKEVVVSMFSIEGTTEYVSGLRFVFERYHEEVAIGYIGGEGTNLLFEPAQPLHQLTATFHGRGFVNIVINNLGPDVGRGFVDTENNKQGQEIETISMNLQGKRSLMALLDGSRIIALAVSPVSVLK